MVFFAPSRQHCRSVFKDVYGQEVLCTWSFLRLRSSIADLCQAIDRQFDSVMVRFAAALQIFVNTLRACLRTLHFGVAPTRRDTGLREDTFLVLRHRLRHRCTGQRKMNENREDLHGPKVGFSHNRKCFLKFLFFCFSIFRSESRFRPETSILFGEPVETFRPETLPIVPRV